MTQGSEANKAFTTPPIDHARDLRAVVRILEDSQGPLGRERLGK